MKLTRSQLKQIIKEELGKVLELMSASAQAPGHMMVPDNWEEVVANTESKMTSGGLRDEGDPPIVWFWGPDGGAGAGLDNAPPKRPGEKRYYHPSFVFNGPTYGYPDTRPFLETRGDRHNWTEEVYDMLRDHASKWGLKDMSFLPNLDVLADAVAIVYELKDEHPGGKFQGPYNEMLHDYTFDELVALVETKAAQMTEYPRRRAGIEQGRSHTTNAAVKLLTNPGQIY